MLHLILRIYAPIAQLVEQRPFKPMVGGSNPSGRTYVKTPLRVFYFSPEGFERAEAKQDDFQQKVIAVCVDECEEYEPAYRQAGIQRCPGRGASERRRTSDEYHPLGAHKKIFL